jgi:LacI family transcriptional regulator
VAETTRQRVIQAARELDYQPTSAARQLRRQRADAIGYILPTSSPRFSDPFYANFLTGLCDQAAESQIDMIITSCPPESDREQALYRRWFESKRVDGMVLNRIRVQDWRVEFLSEHQFPFVALGNTPACSDFPCIVINERKGFEQLVEHLVSKGHRRIAYIGASPSLVIQVERFAGYRRGLELFNLPFDEKLVIQGDLTEDGGYQTARKLLQLSDPPTAILGCNDLTALGVLRTVQEAGKLVGKDIAVAGYDGIKETEFSYPPLTTLFQPTYEIARRLTAILIARINGDKLDKTQVILEPELIIRASTG